VNGVAYTAELTNEKTPNLTKGIPTLLDPGLLKAARNIYRTYCRLHTKLKKNPMGVAIDRKTHRGQLLFSHSPILLPGENFIPLEQLDSEIQ
jgi:hypothetical protein